MSEPRILAIMGSGEVAPAMAKVHRALFERLAEATGDAPVPAAIIDTPYGFQENADLLSERMAEFFATSVGRPVRVASFRSRDADAVSLATALARIRESRYVMAGPGSPTYALRQWAGSGIPEALADKLATGGVVTMASAAALTLGVATIPVYEIYKVGDEPHWVEGLDILGAATGLRAAVVPHYDNAEGGNHDTRFCYMGERRLRRLERELPEGAFVLGVDGHTALVLDLEQGTASVAGLGRVTVRVAGRSVAFPSGHELPIAALERAARALASGEAVEAGAVGESGEVGEAGRDGDRRGDSSGPPGTTPSHADEVAALEGAFVDALGQDDVRGAVQALLELESTIAARLRSGEDSPDLDGASATFRSLVVRLGEHADGARHDDRATVEPFVSTLLELRGEARARRDWAQADRIRDRLAAAGIEVRDDPTGGSSWLLPSDPRD